MAKTQDDSSKALELAPAFNRSEIDSQAFDLNSVNALLAQFGISAEDAAFDGDLWPIVDKDTLVNTNDVQHPFFAAQWQFGTSPSTGAEYVNIWGIDLTTGTRFTLYDSGSGIRSQMDALTAKRLEEGGKPAYNGMIAKGLTRSEYGPHPSPKTGEILPGGTTYYLA